MNAELNLIAERLETAQSPEEVFGAIGGAGAERMAGLKAVYHRLAKVTHPDVYPSAEEQRVAAAAFRQLVTWYIGAEAKIKAGAYGRAGTGGEAKGPAVNAARPGALVLETKKHSYIL